VRHNFKCDKIYNPNDEQSIKRYNSEAKNYKSYGKAEQQAE